MKTINLSSLVVSVSYPSDLRPFCIISANFAADAVHFGENIATSNLKAMLGVNETGAGYAF